MTRHGLAVLLLLSVLAACRHGAQTSIHTVPGHGAISIEVVPNPIVAKRVTGHSYDFPFEIVLKETGGHAVRVTQISMTVFAPGGFPVSHEIWTADQIRAMGSSPAIGASSEVRYRFNPRRDVPDDRLFAGASAELKVEVTDEAGSETSATATVTARK